MSTPIKLLPPVHGILRTIAIKEAQAARDATEARSQRKCPREAHERAESADRLAIEAGKLREFAADTADMVVQLEAILDFIRSKKTTSTFREIAERDIENAAMRLRRELGDAPPSVS